MSYYSIVLKIRVSSDRPRQLEVLLKAQPYPGEPPESITLPNFGEFRRRLIYGTLGIVITTSSLQSTSISSSYKECSSSWLSIVNDDNGPTLALVRVEKYLGSFCI
jgi:hypothetical protein